ncbi:MAG: prepilin-type N-terminal cleavage/methylation domain-containing protein, partial [Candidatus Aminicenantaceae bacterium]
MFKRSKGFTLIELLIVVAIIGILAALLIPNMMTAMQRAKQKGTMADISTIATYLMDYTTDRGIAPNFGGTEITSQSSLYTDLIPDYARAMPSSDQWGNNFIVFSGASFSSNQWGLTSSGNDSFAVGSPGREGEFTFTYVEA